MKERVRAIQRVVGVKDDGDLGPITLAAIERALGMEVEAPPLATLLVEFARKEVGVKEVPNNRGKRVEEYQAATSLAGTGWPWCAAFVCWLFAQAEKAAPLPFERPTTAAAFGFEAWAKAQGHKVFVGAPDEILAGDIVIFSFSHIGIAEKPSKAGQNVATIEGNTNAAGEREGGAVMRKIRNRTGIRSVVRIELS